MSAPLVAVSAAVSPADGSRPERVSLNSAYLRAIADAGGLPLVLAPSVRPATIIGLLSRCSGLMLTGGGDLFPGLYGEDPHPKTAGVSVERDRMEVEALGWALERKRPILAICRGMQVLNVALGGSLYQDLPEQHPSEVNHAQTAGGAHGRAAATHAVRIAPGSGLAALLGGCDLMTNSMHHQALKVLGAGVTAVGHAADGVVEAIEMAGERWVFGVQWHPEEMAAREEHARRLFGAFVEACRDE